MRQFLLFLVSFLSGLAFAESPIPNPSRDNYTELTTLFDSADATAPTGAELETWRTGRCFSLTDRNLARPGILFTRRENDGGPLFPTSSSHKLFFDSNFAEAPAFYDEMSQERKAKTEAELDFYKRDQTSLRVVDAALTSTQVDPEPNGPVIERRVKKVSVAGRTYFIAETVLGLDFVLNGRQLHEGDIVTACYFYDTIRFTGQPAPAPAPLANLLDGRWTTNPIANDSGTWTLRQMRIENGTLTYDGITCYDAECRRGRPYSHFEYAIRISRVEEAFLTHKVEYLNSRTGEVESTWYVRIRPERQYFISADDRFRRSRALADLNFTFFRTETQVDWPQR